LRTLRENHEEVGAEENRGQTPILLDLIEFPAMHFEDIPYREIDAEAGN
jgi:hypothetical protein